MSNYIAARIRKLHAKTSPSKGLKFSERTNKELAKAWDSGDFKKFSKVFWKAVLSTGNQKLIDDLSYKLSMAYGNQKHYSQTETKEILNERSGS